MAVAIVTPVLHAGDAVGNDALGMARALRAVGHDVRLFAEKASIDDDVYPLEEVAAAVRSADDVLIYHHSIRCDAAVRAVEGCRGRAAVKYHNVTPPHFFADIDPETAAKADAGRRQAARLAKSRATIWTDSPFNARELSADPGRCAELPPFHQTDELLRTPPDAAALGGVDDWATTFLAVGRVAPNKNLGLAVEALADYRRRFDPAARLVVAGFHPFPAYSVALEQRARELGVGDAVVPAGRVSVGQLKALYLSADALLVTSDHEGFCVPLLEAMALGVPTVAVPAAAVPDTAGDAAEYADKDAAAVADALHLVVADGPRREDRVLAGRRRYAEHFTNEAIGRRFAELFAGL